MGSSLTWSVLVERWPVLKGFVGLFFYIHIKYSEEFLFHPKANVLLSKCVLISLL